MKALAFLSVAVIIVVGVWLVAGPRDESDPDGIDLKPDDRSTPVNFLKNLRDVNPTSEEVGEAILILGVLRKSLTEAEEQRLLVKNSREAEWHRTRGEVNSLKFQVAQRKGSYGVLEVIQGLERRIEGLGKNRDDR